MYVELCTGCYEIFNKEALQKNGNSYFCPKASCDSLLVAVDEDISLIIKEFWQLNIQTFFCCSGHIFDNSTTPYIMFGFTSKDKRSKFIKMIKKVSEEENKQIYCDLLQKRYDLEGFVDEEHSDAKEFYVFCVRIKENDFPLDTKYQFLKFLYNVINKIKKGKLNGE